LGWDEVVLFLRTVVGKGWEFLSTKGLARWIVFVFALLVLFLMMGFSLFRTPAYEVVYSSRWIAMPAEQGRTAVFCTLEVANAGRKPQDDVKIHFAKAALDHAVLRPIAKNFGVVDRAVTLHTSGLRTTLELGRLEPAKRVTVNLFLSYTAFESAPVWDQAFKGIELTHGKARVGDPELTAAGRSRLADFLPF
jgi:hypothetical protein